MATPAPSIRSPHVYPFASWDSGGRSRRVPSRPILVVGFALVFPFFAFAAGCQAGDCYHGFEEPILHIEAVTDAESEEPLEEVELWDFEIDSRSRSAADVAYIYGFDGDTGISLDEDEERIVCEVPCAMGSVSGTWTFSATADGYETTEPSFLVEYSDFDGGCPSYEDGGERVELTLDPAP